MDVQFMRKLSVSTTVWLSLFFATIITDVIGKATSLSAVIWPIHSISVGISFTGLKIWNRFILAEPLLDVNLNCIEMSISIVLAMMVSLFGGVLFQLEPIQNSTASLVLAIVMTTCQFSLLKSTQPDPASPTHGFNRIVSLSRPIYFCLLSSILLACQAYIKSPNIGDGVGQRPSLIFYSFDIFDKSVISKIGDASISMILFLPVLYLLGLLPQITTFIIHIMEQIDMHFFGSTSATLGLKSAAYSFARSSISILLLYLIALQSLGNHIMFSFFSGLLVSMAYLLSRQSSDTTVARRALRRLIKALNPAKYQQGSVKIEMEVLRSSPSPPEVVTDLPSSPSESNEVVANQSTPVSQTQQPNEVVTTSDNDEDVDEEDSTADMNSQDASVSQSRDRNHDSTNITLNDIEDQNNNHNDINVIESDVNPSESDEKDSDTESISTRIQNSVDDVYISRLKQDLIRCICSTVLIFALHVTSVFSIHHHQIERYFGLLALIWGFTFHFVLPQLRRDIPFMCVAKPVLRPKEYDLFEVKTYAKLMWYEKLHFGALAIERNFIYPIFWLNVISHDAIAIRDQYGPYIGPFLMVMMGLKLVRSSFNDASPNYLTIIFTYLFFNYDITNHNHKIFLINYFVFSILHLKIHELLLKLQFVYVYIAPWQIPWGSAFHAFAQPFSVPHSALLFCQAILSSILSAPLQPLMGSAVFVMSYVRPVKFWERDYNTNVIDINTTRLVTQLEKNRIDSNRLDGVFYEQLTKCLQRKLCKDLAFGRWGPVSQGDCFIMASDNLNCLVHIIELGNGLCTFQLRGLEFKGTYCQQQEVEAITEGVTQDDGFCCCRLGHLPHFLSANASFAQMWLAWHVTHTRYVLEGYSISDNPAGPMLQAFDLRRALITYYVKAIIYFTMASQHLSKWLRTTEFHDALESTKDKSYADLDPTFSSSLDLDFDLGLCGVTREKFCSVYFDWIKYCVDRIKTDKNDTVRANSIASIDCKPESFLVSLCFGLSLVARRSLSAAADGQQFHTVESLLFGLHALLKGDFRVTSLHDEWIFKEMRLFKLVVIPAVRMALKLHLDHFAAPDDYEDNMVLYEAIAGYQKNLVISHETDVSWRSAVLSGVPSLLTLRLYNDDGSNQYKFIMLNRRYLSFRIIKINRECVRGLWASQQQELIFFQNTDPERGSIQNAKQALRNMINSSCDQPVGYPIYVSPLTTSYLESGTMSSFLT